MQDGGKNYHIYEMMSYTAGMRTFMRTSIAILVLSCLSVAEAQAPSWINYQGKLTNASGVSLPDGSYTVTFKVYGAPTGGSVLWTETKSVQVKKGVFSSALGLPAGEGGTPFASGFFTQRRWLGITVGSGAEMTPRYELGAVPYALGVPAGAITSSNIADNAIITAKLADNSVTAAKLASDAGGLAKVTGGVLTASPIGLQTSSNKFMGIALGDTFLYGSSNTGHYSLGWFDNDPSGWTSQGPVLRLASYGGIKLFSQGGFRFGISPNGTTITKGSLYVDSANFGGDPSLDFAIGDTDTGFDWRGDGTLWLTANNSRTATIAANYFEVHGTFVNSSSARYKKHIRGLNAGLSTINKLRPVSYNWKDILDGKKDIGFVAEEVAKVVPEITALNDKGEVEGIDYTRFSAILVKAMQEQEARHLAERKALAQQLKALEARLVKLERGR